MNMWLAIVLIVAVVMIAETVRSVAKAKAVAQAEARQGASHEDTAAMTQRIDELEERVRVLERIVTEDKHDLRREISNL